MGRYLPMIGNLLQGCIFLLILLITFTVTPMTVLFRIVFHSSETFFSPGLSGDFFFFSWSSAKMVDLLYRVRKYLLSNNLPPIIILFKSEDLWNFTLLYGKNDPSIIPNLLDSYYYQTFGVPTNFIKSVIVGLITNYVL